MRAARVIIGDHRVELRTRDCLETLGEGSLTQVVDIETNLARDFLSHDTRDDSSSRGRFV